MSTLFDRTQPQRDPTADNPNYTWYPHAWGDAPIQEVPQQPQPPQHAWYPHKPQLLASEPAPYALPPLVTAATTNGWPSDDGEAIVAWTDERHGSQAPYKGAAATDDDDGVVPAAAADDANDDDPDADHDDKLAPRAAAAAAAAKRVSLQEQIQRARAPIVVAPTVDYGEFGGGSSAYISAPPPQRVIQRAPPPRPAAIRHRSRSPVRTPASAARTGAATVTAERYAELQRMFASLKSLVGDMEFLMRDLQPDDKRKSE